MKKRFLGAGLICLTVLVAGLISQNMMVLAPQDGAEDIVKNVDYVFFANVNDNDNNRKAWIHFVSIGQRPQIEEYRILFFNRDGDLILRTQWRLTNRFEREDLRVYYILTEAGVSTPFIGSVMIQSSKPFVASLVSEIDGQFVEIQESSTKITITIPVPS